MTSDNKFTFIGITIIVLLIILIFLNLGRNNFPPRGDFRKNHEKMFQKMLKTVDATPKQVKELTAYNEINMKKMKTIADNLHTYKNELRQELEKENFNEENIKTIHAKIKKEVAIKEDYMLEMMLQIHKVLNKEQLNKLHKNMEKMSKHRRMPPPL